jgi:ATP-binding cassette subfamily B protein RaxB
MADGGQKSQVTATPEAVQFGWHRQLPVVHQAEVAECGMACLTMIARYYGHDVDLAGLRRKFAASAKGTNLANLGRCAQQLGFGVRPVKLSLDSLSALKTPAILHWDMNHFVVLKKATARRVVIHDPAYGQRTLSWKEASDHFTGVAMEVSPVADMAPVTARQRISWRKLAGDIRGLGAAALQILLLAVALEIFNVLSPFYMQWILDQVVTSADHDLLMVLGLGFAVVSLVQTGLTAARSWSLTWLGAVLNTQWSSNVAAHLLRLPLQWFERRHVGDILSRLSSTQSIQRTLTTQFAGSILDGGMSIVTLVVMGLYSVPLMLVVLGLFIVYGAVRFGFYRPLRDANERQIVQLAKQQSEILESIRGIMPIKLANQEGARTGRFANAVVATTNQDVSVQRLTITFAAVSQGLFGVGRVILIWLAARAVLNGELSVGVLVAFAAYADQFISRSSGFIEKMIDLRMLSLQGERLADITMSEQDPEPAVPWQGSELKPSLNVRNLSFRFSSEEPWVFRNVSFEVLPGESLAIVGPSGCGKTTLAKILCGLLSPTEGEVLFGGVPIHRLGQEQYLAMLAVVMQEDTLLAGSLLENIALGSSAVDLARVVAAASAAAIHADIQRMPMGYQTPVGDMGATLSGGQKQRVLLARALYRQPKLLLLDEATSHLDYHTEAAVNAAVKGLQVTRIIIAHRQETIATADRVLDLSEATQGSVGRHA